ncbi:MAG TPA: hypothetical protein ENK43_09000 [Planctomycetes bacterium]|nr:hypothetical protein [Planctomycetota bacterium]
MARSEAKVPEAPRPARKTSHYSTEVEDETLEFIRAIEDFKRKNAQPFPSWSEVLQVLKGLGYSRQT